MHKRLAATLIAWLALVCQSAFANGATFTYQGRLLDQGAPANGVYDFTFTLADAATEGAFVAGPLTNAAVAVTNGSFTVLLDFGAASFDGSSRWLELGVRTNGSTADFAILSPRQVFTAVPYALYASSAGTAATATNVAPGGAILAAIRGTNIVAGTLNSNAFDSATLSMLMNRSASNLLGSLVGSNQITAQTLDGRALTQDAFYRLSSGAIFAGTNVNRYAAYRQFLRKLADGQTVTLMMYGNGWAEDSTVKGVYTRLTNYVPVAGFLGSPWFVGAWLPYNLAGGAVWTNGTAGINPDGFWLGPYMEVPGGGSVDYLPSGAASTFDANVIEIDYLAHPLGGTFTVQTSINGGAFADVPGLASVSTVAPITNGVSVRVTNSVPARIGVRIIGLSGINKLVAVGGVNTAVRGGVILTSLAHQGIYYGNFVGRPPTILGPILQSWSPDLVLCPGGGMTNEIGLWQSHYSTQWQPYVPNAGIVIAGIWQEQPAAEAVFNRAALQKECLATGCGYFDGYYALGTWTEAVARGYISIDMAHLTPLGYDTYAAGLWDWLDLLGGAGLSRVDGSGLANVPSTATIISTANKTASSVLTYADSGLYLNNAGATAALTNTLPPTCVGKHFALYIDAAQTAAFRAVNNDTIRIGSSVSSPAGLVFSSTTGSAIHIYCPITNNWVADSTVGTWTVQ